MQWCKNSLGTYILNNKLNTIECIGQPLKFPIARHCSMLTGIIQYNKQPSYMNPMQQWWFTFKFKNLKKCHVNTKNQQKQ